MFSVKFYIDNTLKSIVENVSFSTAYSIAVPTIYGENRWHILRREEALVKVTGILAGETIRIAWEDILEGRSRSHVLIMKEDTGISELTAHIPPPPLKLSKEDSAHRKALALHKELNE